MTKKWETYEEVCVYLLNQFRERFGLSEVQGKQNIDGLKSGTTWEIDGKGIKDDGIGYLIVEMKRYTNSKLNQEILGGLAYRILDTGAKGGIIVSPLGLQIGAEKVAKSENIIPIQIDPLSSRTDYFVKFMNELMIGVSEGLCITDSINFELLRKCTFCGENFKVIENEKYCKRCNKKI